MSTSDENRPYDPIAEFCALYAHATIVVDNHLYILQGYATYVRNSRRKSGGNPHLRFINLSQTIDVARSGEFVQVVTNRTQYPENIPQVINPSLWFEDSSNQLLLSMGGTVFRQSLVLEDELNYNPGAPGELWVGTYKDNVFNDYGDNTNLFDKWGRGQLALENQTGLISSRNTFYDTTGRVGYIVGGSVNTAPTNSFITFDFNDRTWTNRTLPWGTSHGNSAMGSIFFNERLVHIHVGGYVNGSYIAMNHARIYDTETQDWYTQDITGTAPSTRGDSCTAVVSAPDGSSHQIYMFGGSMDDSRNSQYFSELWVLNIPSFTWILLDNSREGNAPSQRSAASCNIVKDHYLLVYGGKKAAVASQPAECEPDGGAAYFMDLNTLTWLDTFEGSANKSNYSVPPPISDVLGGNGYGGANLLAPPGGFENEILATIFAINGTRAINPNGTQPPGPGSTSQVPERDASPSSVPVGAIVGGVLGGLLLVALAALAFFCVRKRRKAMLLNGNTKLNGIVDDLPVGGRSELPALPEGGNYQYHLSYYKNQNSGYYQDTALGGSQGQPQVVYSYELATPGHPYAHELESPFGPGAGGSPNSATRLVVDNDHELPLPPTPPSAPQPQH
ncbi:hypothetical protein TWF730_003919 [Orbilia blumenaviensis]|uniref:Cell wall anchored protein n=1 Tax=Orbilia blumenaviensis TaxID=1796055 RepID=A0AAV9U1M8_9PEZI